METNHFSMEPTLKLPMFLIGSNLRFNTPLPITNHQHILLDNLWASRNKPKNLIPVLHTMCIYFHHKNKSISQTLNLSITTSQVLKLHIVEYFIKQDRKIKFLETELKVPREKET